MQICNHYIDSGWVLILHEGYTYKDPHQAIHVTSPVESAQRDGDIDEHYHIANEYRYHVRAALTVNLILDGPL